MSESTENKEQTIKTVQPQESNMSFKQKARLVFLTLLAIVLGTFIVQNSNKVELEFMYLNFRVRIIFIILFSTLIGAIITFLLMKQHSARKRRK